MKDDNDQEDNEYGRQWIMKKMNMEDNEYERQGQWDLNVDKTLSTSIEHNFNEHGNDRWLQWW